MTTRVKICGITNLEDALLSANLGAHALGFVFYEGSRRFITPEKARLIIRELPPFVLRVGVFVNESWGRMMEVKQHCGLDRVQIHADRPQSYEADQQFRPETAIVAFNIESAADLDRARRTEAFPLLDAFREGQYGGTGISFDWSLLTGFDRPFILAGGIGPGNLEAALHVNPYAVDIASGVEKTAGIKDHDKLRRLFAVLERSSPA